MKFLYSPQNNSPVIIDGLRFKNRLGLAAGFDKNGVAIRFFEALGFSHAEVGTITPEPQDGNPKPRIFRLKKDEALINRLGFNNKGADEIRRNILEAKKFTGEDFIIGVNIGKNRDTPIDNAVDDYKICFEKLFDVADYFTINVSSPNTKDLRQLQDESHLKILLMEIQKLNADISKLKSCKTKCIFLKIAPDLTDETVKTVYRIASECSITGIIATNTTIERNNLIEKNNESGGLSGKPLSPLSKIILSKLNELNSRNESNKTVLISVGGVFSKKDFTERINLGAALVQLYTSFIYEGPSIVKKILN